MALCKWNEDKKTLEPAEPVKLSAKGLKERDLQHVVRDTPEVLEEGLFVIAEEYSNWEGSGRSIDLLALDEKGRLVVVELKRTPTGNHMDLQAVRYAAMVSNMTDDQVVQAHRKYLASRNRKIDAAAEIRAHLDGANEEARVDSKFPRILLASGGFSIELTTSVLWLNDNGLDINQVRSPRPLPKRQASVLGRQPSNSNSPGSRLSDSNSRQGQGTTSTPEERGRVSGLRKMALPHMVWAG